MRFPPCLPCACTQVDSLCSSRGEGESEAARRIKTQLMVEMQVRGAAMIDWKSSGQAAGDRQLVDSKQVVEMLV